MATAKKKVANSKVVAIKAPAKSEKRRIVSKELLAAKNTSTSVVSANTNVAKTYEEKRLDEVRLYAEKAVEISGKFDSVTKKIAAFETEMLYKYLGQTFELYMQIEADKKNKDFFYDNLRWHLKESGVKTNKNTSEISLLIRLIFKVKPKTAHLYSRAIEAAYEAKVKPAAFIEYVEEEGGLEKLRIGQVEKEKAEQYRSSLKKANDLAWRYLQAMEAKPLAVTEIPLKNTHVTPNHFVILVGIGFRQPGNPNQNAEVRVLSCLPSAKDTEDFVIGSIAKKFATNLAQAEKFIEKLEGNDVK